ncbi:hypothetical protein QEN19_002286 [Hanseniaspora menglaensis]
MSSIYDLPVSWSKYGIILYSDGPNLGLTYLENLNGKNWRLAPSKWYKISKKNDVAKTLEAELDPSALFSNTLPIAHIQFNNWATLGGETAAVIDIGGNVTLVTLGYDKEKIYTFDNFTISFQDIVHEIPGSNDVVDLKSTGSTYYDLKYFANQVSDGYDKKYTTQWADKENNSNENDIKENIKPSHSNEKYIDTGILSFQWIGNSKKVMTSKLQATWKDNTNFSSQNVENKSVLVNKLQFNNLPLFGCFYPHYIKHVFCAIRRNSEFVLWYNFLNSRTTRKVFLKLDVNLGEQLLEDSQIAYCQEQNCFLISTLLREKNELKIYKLSVDWNLKQYQLLQQKQEEQHPNINANELPHPILKSEEILSFNLDTQLNGIDCKFIKHYFLNRSYEDSSSQDAELILQYESINILTGSVDTTLRRYMVKKLSPTTLSTSIPLVQDPNVKINRNQLKHLSDLLFEKNKVLQLDLHSILDLVIIRLSDGEVETFKRSNWTNCKDKNDLINSGQGLVNGNLDISTPLEVGFKFQNLQEADNIVEWSIASPLAAGLLYKFKGNLELRFKTYSTMDKNLKISELQIISLAHNFVHCTTHQPCGGEDVSLAIFSFLSNLSQETSSKKKDILFLILKTCFKFFGFMANSETDYIQKILVTKPMQKLTLLHLELSRCIEDNENSTIVVRILLQLRTFWFAISQVSKTVTQAVTNLNNIQQQQDKSNGNNISILSLTLSYTKQDAIESILTFAKWFFKLINLINKEMILILNKQVNSNSDFIMAVVCSKITRSMFLANISELKKLTKIVVQFKTTTMSILQQSSNDFLDLINGNSKLITSFELFLTKLDENLKKSEAEENQQQNLNNAMKLDGAFKETLIFSKGEIHKNFGNYKQITLHLYSSLVLPHLDISKVYFSNAESDLKLFTKEFLTNKEAFQNLNKYDNENIMVNGYNELFFNYYNKSVDDITKEELKNAKSKKQFKQCNRCNSITISSMKNSVDNKSLDYFDNENFYYFNRHIYNGLSPNLISRRWNSSYYQMCICSGILKSLPETIKKV